MHQCVLSQWVSPDQHFADTDQFEELYVAYVDTVVGIIMSENKYLPNITIYWKWKQGISKQ